MFDGIDRLCSQLAERQEASLRSVDDLYLRRGITSPIERIFLHGLQALVPYWGHEITPLVTFPDRQRPPPLDGAHFPSPLRILCQADCCGAVVDFVLRPEDRLGSCPTELIVECDGHDFHERTKEQASRDRARDRNFQDRGFTVYRFTGSELWRDPLAPAEQVLKWCDRWFLRGDADG